MFKKQNDPKDIDTQRARLATNATSNVVVFMAIELAAKLSGTVAQLIRSQACMLKSL